MYKVRERVDERRDVSVDGSRGRERYNGGYPLCSDSGKEDRLWMGGMEREAGSGWAEREWSVDEVEDGEEEREE